MSRITSAGRAAQSVGMALSAAARRTSGRCISSSTASQCESISPTTTTEGGCSFMADPHVPCCLCLSLFRSSRGRLECAAVAAAEPLPEIDDVAKEVCCAFGVVQRGMRLALIPFEPGRLCGTRQYGLAEGEAAERGRVEGAEGVKGVDTRKGKRGRFLAGAREGRDVTGEGLVPVQPALIVEPQGDGGDLEQRIGLRIETARLHIHGDGKETTKTMSEGTDGTALRHAPQHTGFGAHWRWVRTG